MTIKRIHNKHIKTHKRKTKKKKNLVLVMTILKKHKTTITKHREKIITFTNFSGAHCLPLRAKKKDQFTNSHGLRYLIQQKRQLVG